jgi:amino acid adenylation domain-containing protein
MQAKMIEGYPLSLQQKNLWFVQRGSSAYRAQCAVLIEGNLNVPRFREALEDVVKRYEILRTMFQQLPGMDVPYQVIAQEPGTSYREVDLSAWAPADQQVEVEELFQEDGLLPFNYEKGPLVRFSLVTLSPNSHVLLVALPSQCADGRTLERLTAEISGSYDARLLVSAAPDAAVQYVDFAEWQSQLLQGEDGAHGREYWSSQSWSAIPPLRLPFELQSTGSAEFRPQSVPVGSAVSPGKIESTVLRNDVGMDAFLLACWQTILWRFGDHDDVLVGCLLDGRKLEPLRDALGLFAQYVPVSFHFEEDYKFEEVLGRVHEALGSAYEHQEHFPGKHSYNAEQDSDSAFFPIAYEFLDWPREIRSRDVRYFIYKQYCTVGRFKLKLLAIRAEDSLTLELQFDPSAYTRDTISRLAGGLESLLRETVRNPKTLVSEIGVLGKAERQQLLIKWNDTKSEYRQDRSTHELFEQQVETTPDAIAVVFEDEALSYAGLNRRANRLARGLKRIGVKIESRVGLLVARSPRSIEGVLGILKSGGVYVPLDPTQPSHRLEFIIGDAEIEVLLTDNKPAIELPPHIAQMALLDSHSEAISREIDTNLGEEISGINLAYAIYTSGSTGRPKGVLIEHLSVVNLSHALYREVYCNHGPSLRVSLNAPLTFDASIKQIVQLLHGHTLCIVPEHVRYDGRQMLAFLKDYCIEVLDCTPSQLRLMVESTTNAEEAPPVMLIGGEALDDTAWGQMAALEKVSSYNVYGPTECTVDTTVSRVQGETLTIGRPLANTQVFLLNARLKLVPTGSIGELHIAGAGLARGYMNRGDLTAEKFIPHAFSPEPGRRMYKTGDLARRHNDGSIGFIGRHDHQVKVRGFRLELGEIEGVLREHPEVTEAVVIASDDEFGGKRLVAYVVAPRRSNLSIEELRAFSRDRLLDYMIPSAWVFLDKLPLTRSGKMDRRALPEPEESATDVIPGQSAPRTPVEQIVTTIWAQVLRVDDVSLASNFFGLGGHSLLAAQVISRLNEAFKIDLPLRILFDNSTASDLADRVNEAISSGCEFRVPGIERVGRDGMLQLSFAQQRLWLADQLSPGNPAFVSARLMRMTGSLSEAGLEQVFGEIVRRHEVLRTSFPLRQGEPVQSISPPARLVLPIVDLTELSETERDGAGQQLIVENARHPFDLSDVPLIRFVLLRLAESDHAVLAAMHHIVIDGWSISILAEETNTLYASFSAGRPSSIPELPIQYADFAQWQRALQGGAIEAQLDYWKRQLANSPVLALPTKGNPVADQSFRGAVQPVIISSELSQALYALSRREGVTLHMTLLAAFNSLLYLYSGQEDIVVGVGTAGRDRVELERLVGFFINMLALRVDLSGDPSFGELLKRVRETALAAYARQDVPFERVVAEMRPQWERDRKSLFQAVFSLQNFPASALDFSELSLSSDASLNSWLGEVGVAHFDLMLYIFETPRGLRGGIEYNTDLFDDGMIAQMAACLDVILQKMVSDPDARLFDINLLTDDQDLDDQYSLTPLVDDGRQFNLPRLELQSRVN